MESTLNWEYNSLITELTQGMEKAKQLRFHLYASEALDLRLPDLLLQKVLASYENSLVILKRPFGEETNPTATGSLSNAQKSSLSVDENPKTREANKNTGDHQVDKISPKKRKMQHTWTEQVKIKPESGLEGPTEDGFSWRKYGQKDILGAKYPRSYYRCTYRLLQSCSAIKQVQRSDEDPTMFFITYKGTHTCNQSNNNSVPKQHGKQELKHECHNHQPREQNETLLNLKSNLKVSTTDLDNDVQFLCPSTFESRERDNCYYPTSGIVADDSHQSPISLLFYSPHTSESSYFSAEPYQMMYERAAPTPQQHSESDIAEIVSGHASTTSSPIGRLGFPFDSVEFDTNFPFGDLGFYA